MVKRFSFVSKVSIFHVILAVLLILLFSLLLLLSLSKIDQNRYCNANRNMNQCWVLGFSDTKKKKSLMSYKN